MRISATPIAGPAFVDLEEHADERGFFARAFCSDEFAAAGLEPVVAQCNVSFSHQAGTLRGLHFQSVDAAEAKLVRCTRGAMLDVIVDMRPSSPTLGKHLAVELTAENHRALYIPALFAQSFQTLQDGTEVLYQVSRPYAPSTERGLRYDDPVLGIEWPMEPTMVSDKDLNWPLLADRAALIELANAAGAPS